MKKNSWFQLSILLLIISACNQPATEKDTEADRAQINTMLDQFNEAAETADFNRYFGFFTEDAVFLGTDAVEHWDKKSFMAWAKPNFDKKNTWSFKSMDRYIYFDKKINGIAWFDELLDTRMKICRGSGVVVKQDNQWKIHQYVLSMTFPNGQLDTVIKLKSPVEDHIIDSLYQRKQ